MKTWTVWIFILCCMGLTRAGASSDLVFVVHPSNPVNSLTPREIRDYYFKIKRQWPNGEDVRFVDRAPDSDIRKTFLASILQKSASDVESYWIGQKLYTGNNAPLLQPSEALTIQFVSALKGAIGYVAPSKDLEKRGVKVIEVAAPGEN